MFKTQDNEAAAGLRALEKRVEAVPVAVYEFLQAGGVPAAVTIITSEPVHVELRDAAISLLVAVARKQPQAMFLAFMCAACPACIAIATPSQGTHIRSRSTARGSFMFRHLSALGSGVSLHVMMFDREAKGMEAVAHLVGRGVQLRAGALTCEGTATVAAGAWLLEAALEAGGQPAARAFAEAGGFVVLRMAIACGQLAGQHGTEVGTPLDGVLPPPQHPLVTLSMCLSTHT